MGACRRRIRKLFETVIDCQIQWFGGKNIALVDNKHHVEAWYSYEAQLRNVLQKNGINFIVDVGANEGQFVRKLRKFYSGTIISFEPVSSTFEVLADHARYDPAWHVVKCALGSKNTSGTINISQCSDFNSLLTVNKYGTTRFGQMILGTKKESITIRRLDNVLEEYLSAMKNWHIFIKMDTQGYDLEVFKGMGEYINHIDAIQSEVSLLPIYEGMPHWTESITTFEKNGFGIVGLFPVTRDSNKIIEYDCLLEKM